MIAARNTELCSCGVPKHPRDKIVIEGENIYCNSFCHMKHAKEPHEHRTDTPAYRAIHYGRGADELRGVGLHRSADHNGLNK